MTYVRGCMAVVVCLALCMGQGCPSPAGSGGSDPTTGPQGPAGPEGLMGPTGPQGPQGDTGPQGPAGPAGADGQLRIYGDGSAGDLVITTTDDLYNLLSANASLQFNNVTVQAGANLKIPSGTVIRCAGTFTNLGTVTVLTGEAGSANDWPVTAGQGVSHQAADNGSIAPNATTAMGGTGGIGLSSGEARSLLTARPGAGGGGGGAFDIRGGNGGGELIVLARGAILNSGTISANGGVGGWAGAGGGGGGIVILASPTSITQTGTVSAIGGAGRDTQPGSNIGAGGGGGGGIVHLISPSLITNGGTINVNAGIGGSPLGTGVAGTRVGGCGGGACGGDGGPGGPVFNLNTFWYAEDGWPGYSFLTTADPTSLF